MGLGSFFKRLFGIKSGPPSAPAKAAPAPPAAAPTPQPPPAQAPKAPAPTPPPAKEVPAEVLTGEGGAPPGATMVFQTVPIQMATLVVKSGDEEGKTLKLAEGRTTIGSAPDSEVKLDHPSVDWAHALIRASQGRHTLFDLGSAAGTWVNGDAVSGTFIGDGSSISVGSTELYFTRTGSAAADPESKGFGKNGVLMVRSGPSKGSSFPVGDDDVVIGRKPGEGGAQIDDPSISQRHALVRPSTDGCLVYDLGSYNGTKVNGVELAGNSLSSGDVVKLGEVEMEFVQKAAT